MFLGLSWDTWIALVAAVFAGVAVLVANDARNDAKRASVYPGRRDIFDRFMKLQQRLGSAGDQLERHSVWVEAFHICGDARFLFPDPGSSKVRQWLYRAAHWGDEPIPIFLKSAADLIATYDTVYTMTGSVGQTRDEFEAAHLRRGELWAQLSASIARADSMFKRHLQVS